MYIACSILIIIERALLCEDIIAPVYFRTHTHAHTYLPTHNTGVSLFRYLLKLNEKKSFAVYIYLRISIRLELFEKTK